MNPPLFKDHSNNDASDKELQDSNDADNSPYLKYPSLTNVNKFNKLVVPSQSSLLWSDLLVSSKSEKENSSLIHKYPQTSPQKFNIPFYLENNYSLQSYNKSTDLLNFSTNFAQISSTQMTPDQNIFVFKTPYDNGTIVKDNFSELDTTSLTQTEQPSALQLNCSDSRSTIQSYSNIDQNFIQPITTNQFDKAPPKAKYFITSGMTNNEIFLEENDEESQADNTSLDGVTDHASYLSSTSIISSSSPTQSNTGNQHNSESDIDTNDHLQLNTDSQSQPGPLHLHYEGLDPLTSPKSNKTHNHDFYNNLNITNNNNFNNINLINHLNLTNSSNSATLHNSMATISSANRLSHIVPRGQNFSYVPENSADKEGPEPDQQFDASANQIENVLASAMANLSVVHNAIDKTTVRSHIDAQSQQFVLQKWDDVSAQCNADIQSVFSQIDESRRSLPSAFEVYEDPDLIYLRDTTSNAYRSAGLPIETYPPLTSADYAKIEKLLYHGPKDEVITTAHATNIRRADLQTLDNINWLNDEIINLYLNMIVERSETNQNPIPAQSTPIKPSSPSSEQVGSGDALVKKPKFPFCYTFNTFFFPQYLSKGYASVKRWTRKVDIFDRDLIFIPVHEGAHWCMSVIDFQYKAIVYFDSLYSTDPHEGHLQMLKYYLEQESLDKRKKPFDSDGWKLINSRNSPQQSNGSDCGVFGLKYAEFLSRRENFTFTQKNMSYFRKRMILEIAANRLSPL